MEHHALFCFGSLMDADVLQLVTAQPLASIQLHPARVVDFAQREVVGESYPVLVAEQGAMVKGLLIESLTADAMHRIQFFEGEQYALERVTITLDSGHSRTAAYFKSTGLYQVLDTPWDFAAWRNNDKADFMPRAERFMQWYGRVDAREADQYW